MTEGLKLNDLMKFGDCAVCGRKQMEGGFPAFYCVTITRAGFDAGAVKRAAGLEMMIGHLAAFMGPDEDLAKVIDGPHTVFVHEECAGKIGHLLSLIPEPKEAAA